MHRHGLEAGEAVVHGVLHRLGGEEHVGLLVDQPVLQGLVDLGLLARCRRCHARLVDHRVDSPGSCSHSIEAQVPAASEWYWVKKIESGEG
jgi:hypothetical protein